MSDLRAQINLFVANWQQGPWGTVADALLDEFDIAGPGEVVVDAADAEQAAATLEARGYPLAADRVRAALDAAESAPDTEQGDTYTQRKYADLDGYADGGLLSGPIPFEPDNGYVIPKRAPQGVRETAQRSPDDDHGSDRLTLPETPWTTVRALLPGGQRKVWRKSEGYGWVDQAGMQPSRETVNSVVSYEVLAEPPNVQESRTRAETEHEPTFKRGGPITDPVTREAIEQALRRAYDYADSVVDSAAKRGRDEALAVVAKAALELYHSMPHRAEAFEDFASRLFHARNLHARGVEEDA